MRVVDAKEKRPLAFSGLSEKNRKKVGRMNPQSARIANARRFITAFEGLDRGNGLDASFLNVAVWHCPRDGKEWRRQGMKK